MRRSRLIPAAIAATLVVASVPLGLAAPAAAAVGQVTTFEYTGGVQQYVVPAGVTSVVIAAYGASGEQADHAGAPGSGSVTLSSWAVTPGQQLTVWVGGQGVPHGGWGYGCGGDRGDGGPGALPSTPPGGDGGGGGGASAVTTGPVVVPDLDCTADNRPVGDAVLTIAGGGAGGGGRGYGWNGIKRDTLISDSGTTGGDAGSPAGNGGAASAESTGGRGGSEDTMMGGGGWDWDHRSDASEGLGGGGGGGGGLNGGEGGHDGYFNAPGGGGGTSFIGADAVEAAIRPGAGLGDGLVIITTGELDLFSCTGVVEDAIAPAGAGAARVTAQGGAGGDRDATGGTGGLAALTLAVDPGDELTVFVGCDGNGDGGWGYGNGGDHGTAGAATADDGTGGGGSSAVFADGGIGLIAGGGGGAGGYSGGGDNGGGNGGDGGAVPVNGHDGDGSFGSSHGGCAACVDAPDGSKGGHSDAVALGGGGGGGGAGYLSGDGGHTHDSATGGGGGAGSSWISSADGVIDPVMTAGEAGSGFVSILWGVGGASHIGRYTGAGQQAVVGTEFAAPLQALVTDNLGNPVPAFEVQFGVSPNGAGHPGGLFPGGVFTANATTDEHGIATSPPVTAGAIDGLWYATVSAQVVSGLTATAWYPLTNELVETSLAVSIEPAVPTPLDAVTLTVKGTSASGPPPSGDVSFAFQNLLDTFPATFDEHGVAHATVPAGTLAVGTQELFATYHGDDHSQAASAGLSVTVVHATTSTTLSSSANPSATGAPVTFTATVASGGAPACVGCTVEFTADGTSIGDAVVDASGIAELAPVDDLVAGSHAIVATLSGDANYGPSTGHLTQTVTEGAVSVIVSTAPQSTVYLEPFQLSVTVDPGSGGETPTGDVTFLIGDTGICIGPLIGGAAVCEAGQAVLAELSAGLGTVVTVQYAGDDLYPAASGSVVHPIAPAPTAVTITPSSDKVVSGQSVTFGITVTIPSDPSFTDLEWGRIELLDGDTPIPGFEDLLYEGAPITTAPIAFDPAGTHTISAVFTPDTANLTGSTGQANVMVTPAASALALTTATEPVADQPVLLIASLTAPDDDEPASGASGFVEFTIDGLPGPQVAAVAGVATTGPLLLPAGAHDVTARYLPDAASGAQPALAAMSLLVPQATSTLAATATGLTAATPFTIRSHVVPGARDGTLSFLIDGAPVPGCTALALQDSGASCSAPGLTVGTHAITVAYSGSPGHAPSSITFERVVAAGPMPVTGFTSWWLAALAGALLLGGAVVGVGVRLTRRVRRRPALATRPAAPGTRGA